MSWQRLGLHWMDNRCAFFDTLGCVSMDETEVFECVWVGCRKTKLLRLIASKLQWLRVFARTCQNFFLSPQFFNLCLWETLSICWTTIERQRVVRILWVFFVEYVISSVIPMDKLCCVAARLLDWFWSFTHNLRFRYCSWSLFSSVCHFIGSWQIHSMGIYYLRFFFHIECIFMVLNVSLFVRIAVILLVVREYVLGVWIPHESVSATLEPALILITGG